MTVSKFKVGDRVHFVTRDYGTITKISQSETENYPIEVRWDKPNAVSTFTKDGYVWNCHTDNAPQLTVVDKAKGETEMGKIAGVINHNITSKENEKMDTKSEKFKVGDHVWSPYFGAGVIVNTEAEDETDEYPIEVHWCNTGVVDDYAFFTKDGKYDISGVNPDFNIYSVEPDRADRVIPDLINELTKKPEEDEGVIDRMEDALSKKVDDAVNPSHYKVKGLPEAIDIINHLMHREQYEGFLWGNILKYTYRFGRKGDKAETAGKIAWYATQLKELEEEKRK